MKPTILVADASPLITLALADRLDLLLLPKWPIEIPDAVYSEVADPRFPDGRRLIGWMNENPAAIRLRATNKGLEQSALWSLGFPARDFGEQAALEICRGFIGASREGLAFLLYEDSALQLLKGVIDPRIKMLTTRGFLTVLEDKGRIQSATEILDAAERQGRNMDGQRRAPVDPDASAELRRRLEHTHGPR